MINNIICIVFFFCWVKYCYNRNYLYFLSPGSETNDAGRDRKTAREALLHGTGRENRVQKTGKCHSSSICKRNQKIGTNKKDINLFLIKKQLNVMAEKTLKPILLGGQKTLKDQFDRTSLNKEGRRNTGVLRLK